VRILVFHGYLLEGTGSNVYNARLAAAFVKLGHEVHLLCQDRHPERQPFVDAAGDWDDGALRVRELRDEPVQGPRCVVYRPDIGGLLPVYVADRYEGVEARTFANCTDAEIARYVGANVAAVRDVVALAAPDVALANHLVMGPVIVARALAGTVPYAVKVHGSALEYTVKPQPERFLALAREGVRDAGGVLVGSHHTATSLWRTLNDSDVERRTRLGPPGVDVARFAPREPAEAATGVTTLGARLRNAAAPVGSGGGGGGDPEARGGERPGRADAFARDELAAGEALSRLRPGQAPLVAFVGKLIVSKGIDLLLAAWPLVLEASPEAQLVVVGFGAYRQPLEELCDALSAGDIQQARAIARAGRSREDAAAPARPLRHLLAFLDGLSGDALDSYVAAASTLGERVVLTGRLEHDELAELLPACEAIIVPSTFPEAFGMVAAEAAACGALPISAGHSGLAEVSGALAAAVPEEVAWLLSFGVDDDAVRALCERVIGWLSADVRVRARTREGLVTTVRERWSWEGVARGVVAAARGELELLQTP
jgi:glycosyltransferase involved in cell wall biosynthesis